MSTIKNVAVIGATGNLGPAVVKALLEAGFSVTALTRIDSTSTLPAGVKAHKTDYNSAESLAEAFKGQDAVVSTIATAGVGRQQALIDAIVKAGVKRFIPSEFGVDTTRVTGGAAKILGLKIQLHSLLNKAAAENSHFSWTGISTGMFFDWGLKVGSLGISIPTKTATIWDSGNEPFSGTNLGTIGLAIASVLKHPEETANKYLQIASFVTTQNAVLAALEEETGTKWTVVKKSTADSQKLADEKLAKGDYSAFGDYLKVVLFADGKGTSPKESEVANKELGLPKEDLRETVKAVLAG